MHLDMQTDHQGANGFGCQASGGPGMKLDMEFGTARHSKTSGNVLNSGCAMGQDQTWMQYAEVVDHCMSPAIQCSSIEAQLGDHLVRRARNTICMVYTSRTERSKVEAVRVAALQLQPSRYTLEDVILRLLVAALIIRERAPAGTLLQVIEFLRVLRAQRRG